MNEEDRKYLKNNIEKKLDNIEKSLSSSKPSLESQSSKSLKDLYNAKSERDSRRKLLEEYKKQNENGEATIAQKMELLKETIETSIPKDFKDGMEAMGATMKKGANQALSGASHLTGRLMGLNPLTSLLWQNRDIAKAVWDMGAGSLKMGWGLAKGTTNFVSNGVKGLYNGASALLNWGKNKLSSQKEEDIPDDVPTEKPSLINNNKELDEIESEEFETSTAKKISEIHEYIFKKLPLSTSETQKQEKSRHMILSKGLAGIGKTMKFVSSVIETIMAKQKMVLGGIVLGAMGILALVGWIKGDGLTKALNGIKNNILKGFASEGGQQARENADKYLQEQYDKIKTDTKDFDNMNKTMNLSNGSDFSKASYITKSGGPDANTLRTQDLQVSLQKEGFTRDRAIKTSQAVSYGLVSAKYKNVGAIKPWVLKLPFETWIGGGSDIIKVEGDDTHVDFVLSRGKGKNTKAVIFTNAIKESVKAGTFKPNTQIAVIDVNARLIGDWQDFVGFKENQTLEDVLLNERAPEIEKKYNEIADKPYHTPGLGDALSREADKRLGVFRKISAEDIKKKSLLDDKGKVRKTQMQELDTVSLNQEVEDKTEQTSQQETPQVTKTELPKDNVNQNNNVDKKIKQQQQQIKEAEKPITTKEEFEDFKKQHGLTTDKVAISTNNYVKDQASEVFNISQYNRAVDC